LKEVLIARNPDQSVGGIGNIFIIHINKSVAEEGQWMTKQPDPERR
jgi:hypothetical protein